MKKFLRMADPATGGGSQPANPTASPPQAAETVANGKSEREVQLERENAKLKAAIKQTAEFKRKVEVNNAHLKDENDRLKAIPQAAARQPANPPAKEKSAWLSGWN